MGVSMSETAQTKGTQTLTAKQQRFVEEYCTDFNATRAAKAAGYSEKTASEIGWENLRKPQIAKAVSKRLNELAMSAGEVTKRLTAWGRGDMSSFVVANADGTISMDFSTDEAQRNLFLIKKIKQTDRMIPQGKEEPDILERKTEIELHDAKDAVVQMGRAHKLFGDRNELTGPDGEGIPTGS
jgi:phage terminase small subunit